MSLVNFNYSVHFYIFMRRLFGFAMTTPLNVELSTSDDSARFIGACTNSGSSIECMKIPVVYKQSNS